MRTRRQEAGQAVTALVVAATLLVVGAALALVYRGSAAASQASTIQSGADAAALAGAQRVADQAWGKIQASLNSRRGEWHGNDGFGRAQSYASRNDTRLTTYSYFPLADRVEATVTSDFRTETGSPERASAVAETGRRLAVCIVVTIPGSVTGYETTATCGDITVDVYVDPSGGTVTLLTPPGQLKKEFRVRLVE
ncbi:hypothetical protein KC207_04980 [Phycicoccus sp. BSK3Z-2]|uniref:Uncharacterized protein n=1 Tax=Phycicoccus avicenniae TaxID=2828860 RepID=A0A941HZ82_9MICO|nr:hypothetical protein [Phycicoccus avicenniae]MBR7742640.1 hypothetical protein [Phycicoccus avicenniae]